MPDKMQARPFTIKAVSDEGTGRAVIATLNVKDHDGEVTLPGAFGEQQVKLLPAHDTRSVPLGKALISEEGDLVVADFAMNLGIPAAADWHKALKFDLEKGEPIQEWSYGFQVLEERQGEFEDDTVRFLERVNVFEISPVVRGAGIGTGTLAVKGHRTFADELTAAEAAIKSVVARAKAIKAVRAEDGRDLSKERMAALAALKERLDDLVSMQAELAVLAGKEDPAVAERLFGRFTQISQAQRGLLPTS